MATCASTSGRYLFLTCYCNSLGHRPASTEAMSLWQMRRDSNLEGLVLPTSHPQARSQFLGLAEKHPQGESSRSAWAALTLACFCMFSGLPSRHGEPEPDMTLQKTSSQPHRWATPTQQYPTWAPQVCMREGGWESPGNFAAGWGGSHPKESWLCVARPTARCR